MSVRAKFRVSEITRRTQRVNTGEKDSTGSLVFGYDELQVIKLIPVYPEDSPENKEFYKWTPSGSIELGVLNKKAGDYFKLQCEYYIDFTSAGEEKSV
jgi:hypothetical protein